MLSFVPHHRAPMTVVAMANRSRERLGSSSAAATGPLR